MSFLKLLKSHECFFSSRAIFDHQTHLLYIVFLNYSSAYHLALYFLVRWVPVLLVLELEQAAFHKDHCRADELHRGCCTSETFAGSEVGGCLGPCRAQWFLGAETSIITKFEHSLWRASPNNWLSQLSSCSSHWITLRKVNVCLPCKVSQLTALKSAKCRVGYLCSVSEASRWGLVL